MAITITNGASRIVKVAVSAWHTDTTPSEDYYPIEQGNSDTWTRSDSRGYLMVVQGLAKTNEYYISSSSKIVIEDDRVKDHGQSISPLTSVNA
ncbi:MULTISPECIES: hypothetical protein [unclassified Pseudomonas]|uniref:hypothetical protein n=1 Tax=unclassified Pseudomonas TaxID=196821 RepID=UPI001E48F6F0|nr:MULTISPECIES: hypothetical protein [unclassified Pseudomonas]MCK3852726.1 hypothetical protein [Pseudomonas sp. W2Jun17]UEH06009.1 hypothetical protein LJX92_13580 [Pseudomonas sp. HN8-3]